MKETTRSKKRNEYEILACMLKVARKGATRTRIMYYSNLSFTLLTRHLNTLVEKELVRIFGKDGRLYRTTEKGMRYLSTLESLKRIVS